MRVWELSVRLYPAIMKLKAKCMPIGEIKGAQFPSWLVKGKVHIIILRSSIPVSRGPGHGMPEMSRHARVKNSD